MSSMTRLHLLLLMQQQLDLLTQVQHRFRSNCEIISFWLRPLLLRLLLLLLLWEIQQRMRFSEHLATVFAAAFLLLFTH